MQDVRSAAPCLAVVHFKSVEASGHSGGGRGCFAGTPQEYDSDCVRQVCTKNLTVWMTKRAA